MPAAHPLDDHAAPAAPSRAAAPVPPEPPLVGRDSELATVRAAVADREPRTVVITGPAGVGKSRLLREGLADTPARWALASPVAPVPYGVVRDLVADGEPADVAAPPPVQGPATHAEVVRARVSALRRHPRSVLVVEDLHWADADSLAVLVDLARAPDAPVLLVTSREEPHRPLVEALASFVSTPGVETLALAGLPTGAVATLLEAVCGAPVPARTAMRVRLRTDGLPYWVNELARSGAGTADLADASLPDVAGAALRARVAAAGPEAAQLAEVAAVLGEQVDLDLLARVMDRPAEALLPELRRLVDAWVVGEVEPDRFAFRHALTREAVAGQVPARVRRRWHARAYAALRAAEADDAIVAWHAAGAGLSAETAQTARRAAGAALAAGSGAEALRLAELALEAGAQPEWRIHALAARAAYAAGWFEEAETHTRAWRDGATGGEAADAECLCARLRWHFGDLVGQWRALDAAVSRPGLTAASRARVHGARAGALLRAERYDEAVAEADRAIAAAEQSGESATWRDAVTSKGTALSHHAIRGGDPAGKATGLALLADAERACEEAGDRVTLGRVLNNSVGPKLAGRAPAEQWALWDGIWQRATRLGLHPSLGKIARHAVDLAYTSGQWERGWRAVHARLPEETEPVERVVLAAKAALLALEADRLGDAVRLAERATAEAAGMDQFWAVLYVALVDVARAARTGGVASTVAALTRYRQAVPGDDHAKRPYRALEAAWWAIDAGVPAGTVSAFLFATLPGGPPGRLADTWQLLRAEAAGEDALAVDAGQRARHQALTFSGDVHMLERADTLTRLGRALLRTGRTAAAGELATEAITLLAGWRGVRVAAAQELRRAAHRGEPALTAREREVRALVCDGLANAEIAQRLGISPRTVAVHVSRLLAKTGCASRTELAAAYLRGT